MRYQYTCQACDASAPRRSNRRQARSDRDEHRERAHYGLTPADTIEQIPGLLATINEGLREDDEDREPTPPPRPGEAAAKVFRFLVCAVIVIVLLSLLL